jgi:hypothetical protein
MEHPKPPSPRGDRFLHGLDALSFRQATRAPAPLFVDEFDLPKRHEQEPGAAPDYALLWDDRLWMVELKTEQASHRPTQLPAYFELAAHHCPNVQIDLTYLSPAMPLVPPPVPAGMRFAHVSWHEVTPLVAEVWGNSDQPEPDVASKLLAALASIGGSWATWRPAQLTAAGRALPAPALARPAADRPDLLRAVLALAAATAHDGRQRAVDHPAADLEELQQLRLAARQAICSAQASAPLRRVLPWLWPPHRDQGSVTVPTHASTEPATTVQIRVSAPCEHLQSHPTQSHANPALNFELIPSFKR